MNLCIFINIPYTFIPVILSSELCFKIENISGAQFAGLRNVYKFMHKFIGLSANLLNLHILLIDID